MLATENDSGKLPEMSEHVGSEFGGERERGMRGRRGRVMGGVFSALGMIFG